VNVEIKEQSEQWMHAHSPNKLKTLNKCLTSRKLMAAVFWDRKGVLMVEFMQQGTTITSSVLLNTKKILHRAIKNKRHGMLIFGVMLLYDNACPHTAARTQALLKHFNWEFNYPPYNPDLTPSDDHLLTYLKNWL
jgi:acyl-CoA thioesterase